MGNVPPPLSYTSPFGMTYHTFILWYQTFWVIRQIFTFSMIFPVYSRRLKVFCFFMCDDFKSPRITVERNY